MECMLLGIKATSNKKLKKMCLKLLCNRYSHGDMSRKPDLSVEEKECVTRALSNGKSALQIAKNTQRDHRTIKKIVAASHHERKKRVQPKFMRLTERQQRQIHRQVAKTPLATSLQVFLACDMPKLCRATCCKALRQVASVKKTTKHPPPNQRHKTKRIEWAKKYTKEDISRVYIYR